MDTDSFIIHIKTEDFYADIASDVERWFDTSKYDEKDKRPLPIGKNKKEIGFFKDELDGKIMTEFCALRAKAYAYGLDDDTEKKKAKGTKKCLIKRALMLENYKDSLFIDKIILKLQQRPKSDHHRVYTEEVNKIALSSNDDKRVQTFDKVTTFPYRTNVFKVCEREILSKNKTTPKTKTEDKDMTIPKTKTKTEDKDKTAPKTKTKTEDKTTPKTKTKTEDKTTSKTRTKTEDKDKTTPKTKVKTEDKTTSKTRTKAEDKDKTTPKPRTKTEDKKKYKTTPKTRTTTEDKDKTTLKTRTKTEDRLIQVFQYAKLRRNKKNGNWAKRQIVYVFWDDEHISELCEKWIRYNYEYAYTRFEELRTYSGEVLFTGEHKATTSKDKSNIHIDIDKLQVFKDFITNL